MLFARSMVAKSEINQTNTAKNINYSTLKKFDKALNRRGYTDQPFEDQLSIISWIHPRRIVISANSGSAV